MTHPKLQALADLGQSVWLDFIQRSLITSGGLQEYVDMGLRGVTSNPALFEDAIVDSHDYDEQIHKLAREEKSPQEIYEELVVEDARRAADVLRPVFEQTDGADGFFSLEVNPHLAHDRDGTIREAVRLFSLVDRPNVMIKVPATTEGVSAFQELIEEGVNINVTLMFSLAQYDAIAEAYVTAMEKRAENVYNLKPMASVASIFVSRLDTKVDKLLELFEDSKAAALKGKIGLANAKLAYQHFKEHFQTDRWGWLAGKGARVQRVLYGSTGTKNKSYSDVMYVENLIGPETVNTIPPKTLEAFLDHGSVAATLEQGLDEAHEQLHSLTEFGITLYDVTQELLDDGLQNFVKPYDSLIKTITEKKAELVQT